jgi:hypothetical protein
MRAVMQVLTQWPIQANCAGLLVHHFRKPDKASQGSAGDVNAARGASAIADACRGTVTLTGMTDGDAKNWIIPAGKSHLDYVRLDDARMSYSAPRREPYWFRKGSVCLGGNRRKEIGVLVPAPLQSRVSSKNDLLHEIARAISEHMERDTPHTVSAILAHLPDECRAALKDQKNRGRLFDNAFGGKSIGEQLTDYGKLQRTRGRGKEGTLLILTGCASAPQSGVEAQLSG